MAKYRILTKEELAELEKEFIDFLILNGIPADEWEKIKVDSKKAHKMIELFSDVVFEKVIREITYIEHYSKRSIKAFKCDKDQIFMVGVDTSDPELDLRTSKSIKKVQSGAVKELSIYEASKPYKEAREQELYKMLEQGCIKSDGALYNSILQQLKGQ